MQLELKPEETELVGLWLDLGGKMTGDAVYDRIEWLVASRLTKLADRADGLGSLYRDPGDARLWEYERPFPGAPPRLTVTTQKDAKEKYAYDA